MEIIPLMRILVVCKQNSRVFSREQTLKEKNRWMKVMTENLQVSIKRRLQICSSDGNGGGFFDRTAEGP